MTLIVCLAVASLVALLAAITAVGVLVIERKHPPAGWFVDVDGGRLHIVQLDARERPSPGDPPLVLLHGASGNLEDMRLALGDRLMRRYRVILVDRPGSGWSERSPDVTSPARQAAMLRELLDRLGIDRAVIVGHSFAGAVATAFALDHPERAAGLVLLAPALYPWPTGVAWYYRVAAAPYVGPLFTRTLALPVGALLTQPTVELVFAPQPAPADYARRAAIPLVLRPQNFLANARDVDGLHAFVTVQAPRYGSIKAPTVIITGDRDRIVSPTVHSRALAKALPHSRLVVLEGVGHMPHHVATDAVIMAIDEVAAEANAKNTR